MTTLSSRQSHKTDITSFDTPPHLYLQGIAILTLALILSGFLGVVQDKTIASYGKSTPPDAAVKQANSSIDAKAVVLPDVWEESMFYLHFLSLPVFISVRRDLAVQVKELFTSVTMFRVPLVAARIAVPTVLPALLTNTLTQLLCAAGVNRLTTRVPALTVTLILVVRKAVSLVLSVLLFDGANVTWGMLWGGAFLVFTGTVAYTLSGRAPVNREEKREKKE
jgi:UDP-xylose/UDP-N-acetylglucosamine transporter B4